MSRTFGTLPTTQRSTTLGPTKEAGPSHPSQGAELIQTKALHSGQISNQQTVHSGQISNQQAVHSGQISNQQAVHSGQISNQQAVHSGQISNQQAVHSGLSNQQTAGGAWNLDGMEDKNPFSGFSEEHLSKLDEVLSAAGVQELLQHSAPDLTFLNLDGTGQLAGSHGAQRDTALASTSRRRTSSESLPESIISVVFSDHGYCLNPEKVQRVKVVPTQPATRTLPVLVAVEQAGTSIPINEVPTALNMDTDSGTDHTEMSVDNPYGSPRKSGRTHTKSKYLDEDWVTQGSPTKGKGKGRGSPVGMPLPFGYRASTRISDQKQRDLAEKIMLANRQAMEAEKSQDDTDDTDQFQSPTKGSPKGRGRGTTISSPARIETSPNVNETSPTVGRKAQSSQDEETHEGSLEEIEEEEEVNVEVSGESESEKEETQTIKEKRKKKTKSGKKKKKGGKYEEDSDYGEGENKKDKKKKTKGKKKGKKESDVDEETTEVKTKKGKKKKLVKGKKKDKLKAKNSKKKGGKVSKNTDDSEGSDSETNEKLEEKSPKTIKNAKKKSGIVGKKTDESEASESETKEKVKQKSPKKTKLNKKLSKKERLKKIKEAKEAKKAKLLEKKKAKRKDKKKKGKMIVTETEVSDASPKKKKGLPKGKGVAGKKKVGTEDESTDTSPKKKVKAEKKSPKAGEKRKASPARAAKGKSEVSTAAKVKSEVSTAAKGKSEVSTAAKGKSEVSTAVKGKSDIAASTPAKKQKLGKTNAAVSSPSKKQKLGNTEIVVSSPAKRQRLGKSDAPQSSPAKKGPKENKQSKKSKMEMSDSEADHPVKSDYRQDNKTSQESADKVLSPSRADMNIFTSLSVGLNTEKNKASLAGSNKDEPETMLVEKVENNLSEESKSENIKTGLANDVSSISVCQVENVDTHKVDSDIVGNLTENKLQDKEDKKFVDPANKDNMDDIKSVIKNSNMNNVEQNSESESKENDTNVDVVSIDHDSQKDEKMPSEGHKIHDSEDSRGAHHHHHHHRRHSHDRKESVSEDKKDSGSRRRESHYRRESNERRHSYDRRDSLDRDRKGSKNHREKDRHSRKGGSESKDRDRRDSGKDRKDSTSGKKDSQKKGDIHKDQKVSVSSANSDKIVKVTKLGQGMKKTGKLNKNGKVKPKKSKKIDEVPIDPSMADLFMPDNLPTPKEEATKDNISKNINDSEKTSENSEENNRVSKVTFKDDLVSDRKSQKEIIKSEKEDIVGTDLIQIQSEQIPENLPDLIDNDVLNNEESEGAKVKTETGIEKIDTSECLADSESTKSNNLKGHSEDNTENRVEIDKSEEKDIIKADTAGNDSMKQVVDEVENDVTKISDKEEAFVEILDVEMIEKEEIYQKISESDTVLKQDEDCVKADPEEIIKTDKPKTDNKDVVSEENVQKTVAETNENLIAAKETSPEKIVTGNKPKSKNPLRMSDFFSERRLKINDPKPRQKVAKEETTSTDEGECAKEGTGKRKRNKTVAFAEMLKQEKLGSDEEADSDDSDYEDDENDEDFEDPDELYCICRQPHNQRFMICCDKCEEWFHGKCVGITRARGAEMEKNNEEYMCPQCTKGQIQDKSVVSTTQSPEQPKKSQSIDRTTETSVADIVASSEPGSGYAEESKLIKPDSTVDKDVVTVVVKQKADPQTPKHVALKEPGEATPKSQKSLKKSAVSFKSNATGEVTPKSLLKKKHEVTPKPKSLKAPTIPKSEGKSKEEKLGGSGTKLGGLRKKKSEAELSEKRKRMIQMVKEENEAKDKPKQPYNKCFSCHVRSPRKESLYCSDECHARHSKHNVVPGILKVTIVKDKQKGKTEKHIAVVETSTGRTLTGDKAPAESELTSWLQENPTFEVLKAHNRPAAKSLSASSSDRNTEKKELSNSSKTDRTSKSGKNEGPEPIRLNVRKGLRDALAARADTADDVMLSSSELKGVALSIEEELFKYFQDTDHKYKAKYRSLIFNIKDQKNKGLFRKILGGRVRASKLVRMTADDLANRELAQWREHETKHTIEMIKEVETEQMNKPVHVMKKTHKGEEEVADEEGEDMSTLASEPKKKEEHVKLEQKEDEVNDELHDSTDMHGQHLFDASCKICTGKIVPTSEVSPAKSTVVKTETTRVVEEDDKTLTKKERDLQADEVVQEVLKAIQRAKADERKEKLEAQQRSSVTVRSPDSALSSGLDKNVKFTPIGPQLWKGFIYMQDVSKFVTSAYRVTGSPIHLTIPDTITLCGRISPEHVWDYLNKVKHSATRDICVVRFIPGTSEEKAAYINLYSYLNSRSRCGVVEHKDRNIKDFYIVPLASHSKIPSVLLPFDGPGLEENRCHMLLGVIIRNKERRSSNIEFSKSGHSRHSHRSKSQPLKSALKDPIEAETPDKSSQSSSPKTSSSSSTPQPVGGEKKKAISFDPIVKEYSHISEQDESYEPGSDDPMDLNAPYDPEKEALKGPAKLKQEKPSISDPVSLMMEKIAQSKNPTEATAAMVAALATTSKLGNQRKLLLELTKKVDEQKRLLEQKRVSAKLGQSPSGSSPSSSGTSVSSTSTPTSIGISSKDPRLRGQGGASASSTGDKKVDVSIDPETLDIDMRIKPGMPGSVGMPASVGMPPSVGMPALIVPTPVLVQPSAGASLPTTVVTLTPKPPPVLPPSISTSALEKSVSILSSLTSEIASNAASPVKISTEKAKDVSQSKSVSVKSVASTSESAVVENKVDTKTKLTTLSDNTESIMKPKGFYVDHRERKESGSEYTTVKNSEADLTESNEIVSDSVPKLSKEKANDDKSKTMKSSDSISDKTEKYDYDGCGLEKSESEMSTQGVHHDIISQLMAEVSGKRTTESKLTAEKANETKIHDEIQGSRTEQSEQSPSKSAVPNVAALFKGLVNTGTSSDSGKKSGIQLPSALMSLFSKLPGSAEEPENAPTPIPGLFSTETENNTEDTDLRQTVKQVVDASVAPVESKFSKGGKTGTKELKEAEEKVSNSFMGFDYDSDSSSGSFEGFDDDGTKKLSPRKRKLVQKSPSVSSPVRNSPRTNLFGDVDERGTPPMEDEDLREEIGGDVDLRPEREAPPEDIDERMPIHMTAGTGQPLPPGEGPIPPFPPPPGLRLPFIPSTQPPPPGVDWEHPTPTTVGMPMPNLAPPTGEWGPPLPEAAQPPLPAEPPTPKPPEPPVKKKKTEDEGNRRDEGSDNEAEIKYQSKNSKKKQKKRAKKDKKGGPSMTDERLQQLVLEIAKNEPIDMPPMLPMMAQSMHRMPYAPPQRMMTMPPMVNPMRHRPPLIPNLPASTQFMPCGPSMQGPRMESSSWTNVSNVGTGLDTQSAIVPPNLPPHQQPGVASTPPVSGPDHRSTGYRESSGHREQSGHRDTPMGFKDQSIGVGGKLRGNPPSLLDLPALLPPPTLKMERDMPLGSASRSPSIRGSRGSNDDFSVDELEQNYMEPINDFNAQGQTGDDFSGNIDSDRRRDQEERSRDRDRDERRRRDRPRSRSGERRHRSRSRERNHSRSHEREFDRHHRERSHDRGERSHDHRDWSRDHDRHHYRDRSRDADWDRGRDRGRDSDRDRRHRNSRH